MNENEKKSLHLIEEIRFKVNTIPMHQTEANENYFKVIRYYLQNLVSVGKRAESIYLNDCTELENILSDGTYKGFPYSFRDKILIALNFLEKRIKEDEIEDLMVEYDKHTMYDILTLKPNV
jgi:hypothetical protein